MMQPGLSQQRGGAQVGPGTGRGPMGGGGPMQASMMTREKPKNFRKTMRTFLKYLNPYRLSLVVVFIFAMASTAFMKINTTTNERR